MRKSLLFASLLALFALAAPGRAQDGQTPPTPPKPEGEAAAERRGRVTDVREAEGVGVSILLDLGSGVGVAAGQTIELRRDGKPVGYGSIDTAFADVAVATVGTVVSGVGSLRVGDEVIVRGAGFKRGTPAEAPGPKGRVVGVRDAVVLLELDAPGAASVEVGAEAVIVDANGQERGRIALELVHGTTAGGMLVSGSAAAGDVINVQKGSVRGGIDYVALSFLGVVADLEHPTPHRAPCHVGVPVRRLMPGSPAQRAGISRGDRVIAVDGHIVRDATTIRERIKPVGDRVQVALVRNDRIINVDVVFAR